MSSIKTIKDLMVLICEKHGKCVSHVRMVLLENQGIALEKGNILEVFKYEDYPLLNLEELAV